MAQEERVGTLPSIIERLAQQVDSQDKELASLKQQLGLVRKERDGALREVEELTLDRDSLKEQGEALRKEWAEDVERIKRDSQKELADARETLTKSFEVERTELRKEIMIYEQKAAGHADLLSELQRDVEEWRNRYITLSSESRQRTDAFMAQLARFASILEERSGSQRNASDPELQQSSPTVIPAVESSPISSPTAKKNPRLNGVKDSRTIVNNTFVNGSHQEPSKPTSTPVRRPVLLENGNVHSSGGEGSGPSVPQLGDAAYLPTPSQKRPRVQSQNDAAHSTNAPALKPTSQQQGLPPDREIITAHYEIKVEDDGDQDGANNYFGSDDEDARLRKSRKTVRQRSRRIDSSDDDDDDERDVPSSEESEIPDSEVREWGKRDEMDEMAIGAEDNRQEVYGHRRVNVREVNTIAQTPSRRQPGKSRSMSSGKKRKGLPHVMVNGRPATAKKR